MAKNFALEGYVDVAERLRRALAAFPELRILESVPEIVKPNDADAFVQVTVTVYRTEADPLPTVATCWEPYPGRTPYTRGSEMMNAATSAVGRALGYMGFGIGRSISSANEVANRRNEQDIEPDATPPNGIERPRQDAAGISASALRYAQKVADEHGVPLPAFTSTRDLQTWLMEVGKASE